MVARSRRIAEQFDEDVDGIIATQLYTLNSSETVSEYLIFLQHLLMPLIETYSTTAYTLDKLVGRSLIENELLDEILSEMKRQLSDGSLIYGLFCLNIIIINCSNNCVILVEESVSVDPIKNALKVYQKWDIIECHSEKKLRLYYLKDNQDNSDAVKLVFDKVNKFR